MPLQLPCRTLTAIFMVLASACVAHAQHAQHSLDLNVGLSISKSVLGASYTIDRNQLNVGLRGFSYSGRDGFMIQPGVSYNRYLTKSGYYASLTYISTYRNKNVEGYDFENSVDSIEYRVYEKKGWSSGVILSGIGKSWQFVRWGLHADGGIGTEINSNFSRAWGLYVGGAVSYRFKLGD